MKNANGDTDLAYIERRSERMRGYVSQNNNAQKVADPKPEYVK